MEKILKKFARAMFVFFVFSSLLLQSVSAERSKNISFLGKWEECARSISSSIPISAFVNDDVLSIHSSSQRSDIIICISKDGKALYEETIQALDTDCITIDLRDSDPGVPYNSKLPQQCSYTTQYEGRYPVGCAVVCIAQVLAHLEPYLYCDGYTMDWKSLKKESTIKRSSVATLRNQVGALMKFIGTHTKAVYGCAGTSMNTGYAMTNFLPIYGVISDAEKALNVSSVYSSLSKGNIVVLRGASEEGRHAWILDEYLITQPGYDFGDYNLKIDYVRANMGWGGDESDGFYEISEQGILEFNTITGGNFISGITCFTNVRRK